MTMSNSSTAHCIQLFVSIEANDPNYSKNGCSMHLSALHVVTENSSVQTLNNGSQSNNKLRKQHPIYSFIKYVAYLLIKPNQIIKLSVTTNKDRKFSHGTVGVPDFLITQFTASSNIAWSITTPQRVNQK